MGDLTVRQWKRSGRHRLYVNDADGNCVGWHDVPTGQRTIERPELIDAFVAALGAYLERQPDSRQAVPAPTPARHEPQVAQADLADRRPGEGVRARADEEWEARKDRSRLLAYAGRALDLHTDERAWRRGADGEEAVGKALDKLGSRGWHALHSVPVGERGSDIDHVMIGPGGVYTINTKNHRGKRVSVSSRGVWVTGHRQPYIRNSEHEASRASRLLTEVCGFPVFVRGVVVIFADDFKRKGQPAEVTVLASGELRRWLKQRPRILSSGTAAAIFTHARRAGTWTR